MIASTKLNSSLPTTLCRTLLAWVLCFGCALPAIAADTATEAKPQSVRAGAMCTSGKAAEFPCSNVNLLATYNLEVSGIPASVGSDLWGWTDPETGKRYAIMGLSNKTAFVDITTPSAPVHLGDLPGKTHGILWRDIKVYKNHAFIVSEAMMHGMQVFDLTQLRDLDGSNGPVVLYESAYYGHFGSAHNIGINEETGFAYVVGTHTCDMGVHVINIQDPKHPRFSTCIDRGIFTRDENFEETDSDFPPPEPTAGSFAAPENDANSGRSGTRTSGLSTIAQGIIARKKDAVRGAHDEAYTHDIQCVIYRGPDVEHQGKEICVASNDDTLNIVDVTDKANPVQLAVVKYRVWGFVHQGWLTEDHKYFLLGDEVDEQKYNLPTRTLIFDVQDLDNISEPKIHTHATRAIDHNMYTKDSYVYQANYTAGIRILSTNQVADGVLEEVAFFDTTPNDDTAEFWGVWSVFPYFENNLVIASGMDGILYIMEAQIPAGMIRP